jgi:predicted RNA binding protein YcfA (HicA-like mRNA interferase family)
LERQGFKLARVAGSHHIMRHPDGRGTTVPVHGSRDVAKGTLRGIAQRHRHDDRRTRAVATADPPSATDPQPAVR